jgi:hypothetical protein
MSYKLACINNKCSNKESKAINVLDLIENYVGKDYLFYCPKCSQNIYIEKQFDLQEKGQTWEPFLWGIIPLGFKNKTYQPFIYLVSDSPKSKISSCWFCYYKDTRKQGGKLKLGYGPGGPPVLKISQIKELIKILSDLKIY